MKPPIDHDRLLEMLLAGTPARVIDVNTMGDPEAIMGVDGAREALAALAFALPPEAPSPGLRARIEAAIAKQPHRLQRRALVVMDMQVDHLTPGRPLEVPRAREIVPALKARIEKARSEHEPVIYLCDRHEPGDPELADWGGHNLAGTEGAEVWPEIAPVEGDHVIHHRTYSGFFDTELDATLRKLGVDTVVLTGCITEIHVFATATDALMRGYALDLPPDCQAGNAELTERATLATLSVMRPLQPFVAQATTGT